MIEFVIGAVIGGALVWLFAPRPYVEDEILVEAQRIIAGHKS